jgi:four helix bundle protein
MQDFRQLREWHLAKALALDVGRAADEREVRSIPGLRSQLIRAAYSVPANIAEACAKSSARELCRFLEIALGSLMELENHLDIAGDACAIPPDNRDFLLRRVAVLRRMLIALIRRIDPH